MPEETEHEQAEQGRHDPDCDGTCLPTEEDVEQINVLAMDAVAMVADWFDNSERGPLEVEPLGEIQDRWHSAGLLYACRRWAMVLVEAGIPAVTSDPSEAVMAFGRDVLGIDTDNPQFVGHRWAVGFYNRAATGDIDGAVNMFTGLMGQGDDGAAMRDGVQAMLLMAARASQLQAHARTHRRGVLGELAAQLIDGLVQHATTGCHARHICVIGNKVGSTEDWPGWDTPCEEEGTRKVREEPGSPPQWVCAKHHEDLQRYDQLHDKPVEQGEDSKLRLLCEAGRSARGMCDNESDERSLSWDTPCPNTAGTFSILDSQNRRLQVCTEHAKQIVEVETAMTEADNAGPKAPAEPEAVVPAEV